MFFVNVVLVLCTFIPVIIVIRRGVYFTDNPTNFIKGFIVMVCIIILIVIVNIAEQMLIS